MSKEETVVYSNDERKIKIKFEIENDYSLTITATEENEDALVPKVYQDTFTKERLSNYETTKVTFKDAEAILKEIKSSFNSNKLEFSSSNSKVTLSYFLFGVIPASVDVPLLKNSLTESIKFIACKISNCIEVSNRYKNLIRKVSNNFSKNKNAIQTLHRQNYELKRKIEFSKLLKEQQNEINKKLSSIQTSVSRNKNQTNLQNIKLDNIEALLKYQFKSIHFKPKSKLQLIKAIKNDCEIKSMCFLRDGRLVSGAFHNDQGKICVYNEETYESDIVIQSPHDNYSVTSVCGLVRSINYNLASAGGNGEIKIWKIEGSEYENVFTLNDGHTSSVGKVIELEDGRICSCSWDRTIKIWDKWGWSQNYYQKVKNLEGQNSFPYSIIEINDYIVSVGGYRNDGVKLWNKSTYEFIRTIEGVYCNTVNGLSTFGTNEIIIGGTDEIFVINISSFKSHSFNDYRFGYILSVCVLRNGKVLLANSYSEIIYFDFMFNQIVFVNKLHNEKVLILIENEENQLFSSSKNNMIKVYD